MATIAELNIRLGLLTKEFERQLKGVERRLQQSGQRLSALGSDLTAAVSLPLAALGGFAIKSAGDIEALRLALVSTMADAGRSTEEATRELEELRKSALAPGLDFEQAVKGSIRLQNVGFAAEEARGILEQLANAVALTGGSAQELDGVTRQFAQMISKGRVLQEDLTIISENMPAIAKAMEGAFGTRSAERLRELGVSAEDFIKGVTQQFAQLPRVSGGIKNSLVNLFVGLKLEAARLGEEINKAFNIGDAAEGILKAVKSVVDAFAGLSDSTKRTIVEIGLFAAALGPAIKLLGVLKGTTAQAIGGFRSVLGSIQSASDYIKSFGTTSASATQAYEKLAQGIRLANINKPILDVATASQTASTAIKGMGAASAASVADAAKMKDIASKFIAPITTEAQRAALAAIRMRAAFLAAVGGLTVILAGVAAAVVLMADKFDAAKFAQEQFNKAKKETISVTAKEVAALNRGFETLKNVNASTQEREAAIKDLLDTYPEYLKGIDLEKKSVAELTALQDQLNKEILQGVAERQKTAAVTALYEKQAAILLRIQEIQRTGKTTTSENTLIDTGDLIRNGSRAAAIIVKLREQAATLGEQAKVTAADFDKAFDLQGRALDLQLQREYDLRQAYYDSRDAAEVVTKNAPKPDPEALERAKKQADLYAKALASIAAVSQKGDVLGAEVMGEQAREIENQIERLLENGFKPYGKEIQNLLGMLKTLRADLGKGFETPNLTQQEVGFSVNVPQLPSLSIPDQVVSIDTTAAQAALEGLSDTALKGIESAGQFKSVWEQIGEIMAGLGEGVDGFAQGLSSALDLVNSRGEVLNSVMLSVADAVSAAAASGATSFGQLAQAAVQATAKIVRTWIQQGVAAAVAKALSQLPFPVNLAAGAAAGAIAAGLFNKAISAIGVPALAKGGVIDEPTYALIGEYPGAKSNPEIVTPENKMRDVFSEVLRSFSFNMPTANMSFQVPAAQSFDMGRAGFFERLLQQNFQPNPVAVDVNVTGQIGHDAIYLSNQKEADRRRRFG